MVVLTPRFTVLAALSSIAALSLVPSPADAAAIQAQYRPADGQSLAARHSSHGQTADVTDSGKHAGSAATKVKQASQKVAAEKPQRHAKPVVPLPERMAQKSGETTSAKKVAGNGEHSDSKKSKDEKSKRATWDADPISRMERLFISRQDLHSRGLARTHHHDHHDHDEVVVTGNNDDVHVHQRSLGRVARAPHDDDGRVLVEGHDDHVHVHDEHGDDEHDRVIIKGDDDHVHVHRSPSPRHHHDDDHEKVVVTGDHDNVHVHRSPEPAPRHDRHDHDKVVVTGDHDHVNVHERSFAPRHHREVIISGDHEHVHVGRSPEPRHHHDMDKIVVTGDHDHVDVHRRNTRPSVVISSNQGDTYLVHHTPPSNTGSVLGMDLNLNLRRDAVADGVPGSIDIIYTVGAGLIYYSQSQVANSTVGQRIASLVLAQADNSTASDNSTATPFVLNASGTDGTQMYMVPMSPSDDDASSPSAAIASDPGSPTYIKVALQTPVFNQTTATLEPFCATFDPNPMSPTPLTMEGCTNGVAGDQHKSQAFAYEPATGVLRPMWYETQGDGAEDDSSSTVPTDAAADGTGSDDEDPDDGEGSDDGEGNLGTPSEGANATTVDPTTPASNKIVNVTSFEQEALNKQYGDATRPPTRLASAQSFAADAPQGGQAVTLKFTPTPPELVPKEKPATQSSSTDSGASTVISSAATSAASSTDSAALSTVSDSATAPTSTSTTMDDTTTATATTAVAALDVTASATSSVSSVLVSATTSSSDVSDATTSVSQSTASASATTSPAFEVKVYNPYAEALGSDTSSSSATMTSFATSSSATSTMTPVSTAPYEWMFKQGSLADLE